MEMLIFWSNLSHGTINEIGLCLALTLSVLSLFCKIGHICKPNSSKWVNWDFHLEFMLTWARLAGFHKMTISFAKLALSKKLFNNKSNVHYNLYFPGNFLEMLGGAGQIIGHSHHNLHISMVILADFHKQQSYLYFRIWYTVSLCIF